MVLALLAVSTQAQVTQNFESGSKSSEEARGWVFGAQGVTNTPLPTSSSAIQGSWSAQTNALSSSSLSASWVKTPWLNWTPGTISLDARLHQTGASTYKVIFRFISYSKGAAHDEGTTSDTMFEYTMANNTNVQNISFPVPALVLNGNPWRMRVNFVGTGGSTRIVHDNWSLPAVGIVQDFESGSASTEAGKGWVFGAHGIGTTPGGVSPIEGTYSAQTNQLSSSSLSATWVKTPWAIWKTGRVSLDAKLNTTGSNTYKVVVRFIPWDKCGANEEGTTTDPLFEYTMDNSTAVQTINFPVPDTVRNGLPWRMRVSFIGTGGSTRIVHDNWFLPAAAAFYDTDTDKIPDAMDKYPTDATNNGKGAILARVWDDQDGDGIQDNCEAGRRLAAVVIGVDPDWYFAGTQYNGYIAFFDLAAGNHTLTFHKPAYTFTYFTLQNQGSNDDLDSDVDPSGSITLPVSGVVSNLAVGFITPRVTQDWESGSMTTEQANGWAFGAHSIRNGTTSVFQAVGTDQTPIAGSWSAETNANTNTSPTSSWVQTPWAIWSEGKITLDARLGGNINGVTSRKISIRFYPWDPTKPHNQGTPTDWLYEYDMSINSNVQSISFDVPFQVREEGKLWRMQVGFSGQGGTSRIRHDNWSYPAAGAFTDKDGDNIPDALDEYPGDNTNDGKAAILARAWDDADGDGIQENGEIGIEDVPVMERTSGGVVIRSTTSRYNGYAVFFRIASGSSRTVSFNSITGHSRSPQNQGTDDAIDSDIDNTNGRTASFTATGVVSNIGGGYIVPGTVVTFVWNDLDADGIQDSGEPGIAGVVVALRSGSTGLGVMLQSATTNANGIATFSNVPTATNLRLSYTRPTGHSVTLANQGTDDNLDSDADPASSNYTSVFTMSTGDITHLDCGMWAPGTVETFVWSDTDADGIQDSGEPGLSGITVTLRNSSGVTVQTATTAANGIATFTNVATGTDYRLHFNRPSGLIYSPVNQGSDDALDSDADPANTGTRTALFQLTQGSQTYTLMDCGMYSSSLRIAVDEEEQILRENGNSLQPGANGGIATGNVQQVQKPAAASNNGASNILAGVQVYPNPATTAFHVAIMAPEAAAVSYVLTDASGKTVRNGNWKLNAGANAFTLDVLELKGGVYHLRTEGGQINHSARVIVVK